MDYQEFERRKKELLEEAKRLDAEECAFERWKILHPVKYRRWLKTEEGKSYLRGKGIGLGM